MPIHQSYIDDSQYDVPSAPDSRHQAQKGSGRDACTPTDVANGRSMHGPEEPAVPSSGATVNDGKSQLPIPHQLP